MSTQTERNGEIKIEVLWDFYKLKLANIAGNSWGKVYKDRHEELQRDMRRIFAVFELELDESRFKPLER
jgi:hypothetical protein